MLILPFALSGIPLLTSMRNVERSQSKWGTINLIKHFILKNIYLYKARVFAWKINPRGEAERLRPFRLLKKGRYTE